MLGLIALMDNQYKIKSNRESGKGRYDICMIPRSKQYPGIIMEMKWKKDLSSQSLELLAKEAMSQIETNHYEEELQENGVSRTLKFGIAFSGKELDICTN